MILEEENEPAWTFQVVDAVVEGTRSQENVRVGVLLVALRSRGEEHGLEVARLVAANMEAGVVVGMDVAGDEGSYPLAGQGTMVAGVEEASRLGVPLTLHAGGWWVMNNDIDGGGCDDLGDGDGLGTLLVMMD